jgi:hypothetical protein
MDDQPWRCFAGRGGIAGNFPWVLAYKVRFPKACEPTCRKVLEAKINLECGTAFEYSFWVLVQVFVSDSWKLAAVPASGRQPLLLYAPNTRANGLQNGSARKTTIIRPVRGGIASKKNSKEKE